MVSIIVPVYKVEQYLPTCIESIINQTYRDIEIILVDDGSPDNCGKICDEYARKDKRIKVFHKENGGLSDARNFGLKRILGEYIGFVDGDDWIEPEMYEVLVNSAEEYNADIVYCGKYLEYPTKRVIHQPLNQVFFDNVALCKALINNEIGTGVWSKIYKRHVFADVDFPNGHVFEDTAIMYKLFLKANSVVTISKPLYHYRQLRRGSIVQSHSMANLIDYWLAHKSRYDYFLSDNRFNTDNVFMNRLRFFCAEAIARTYWFCYNNTKQERDKYFQIIMQMHVFCGQNFPVFGLKGMPLYVRMALFVGRFNIMFAFAWLYYLLLGYKWVKRIKQSVYEFRIKR